jgi:hypothetical protein
MGLTIRKRTASPGTLIRKGSIIINSDFPTLNEVKEGWAYEILAGVTDNDATKTNTGQVFSAGDVVYWRESDTSWVTMGSGGSGILGITTQDESGPVGVFDTYDFIGDGVIVTDGGTKAVITIDQGYAENTDVDTGSEVIDSFADTSCDGVIWFYVVKKGAVTRTGSIQATWDATGNTINSNEYGVVQVGDSSDISFSVDINLDNVRLLSNALSDDWLIKVKKLII